MMPHETGCVGTLIEAVCAVRRVEFAGPSSASMVTRERMDAEEAIQLLALWMFGRRLTREEMEPCWS